jgi:hypothetical protein
LSEYEYTKLSLNKEFLDKIQQFIDEYPEKGLQEHNPLRRRLSPAQSRRAASLRAYPTLQTHQHLRRPRNNRGQKSRHNRHLPQRRRHLKLRTLRQNQLRTRQVRPHHPKNYEALRKTRMETQRLANQSFKQSMSPCMHATMTTSSAKLCSRRHSLNMSVFR